MTDTLSRFTAAVAERYVIERELGQGGMATVYLAEDLKHHRKVAIKVLRPEVAAAIGTDRFHREIRITAGLSHPHILPLLDSGEANGFLYYVMPFVEGVSLRDRLNQESQLPIDGAIKITCEVADALDFAHQHDVIHRDIKPENILLEGEHAVVADFGIARAIHAAGDDGLTQTGLAIGTPPYMSPEQATGDTSVDGRADIYSLGCVLYEMLAGEPPYTAPSPQGLLAKKMSEPLPRVSVVRETVPPAVEAALTKALAKNSADRFSRATEFVAALEAGPPGTRPGRKPRAAMRSVVAAALVVLIVAAAYLVTRRPANPDLDPARIAIAPLDVLGPDLEEWSEGTADWLFHRLDGAGELTGIPPAVVIKRWRGRGDPASATALAREVGAGLVIYGQVVRTRGDSVRLRATLFDAANDRTLAEFDIHQASWLDRIADTLAVAVVTALADRRRIGEWRLSSIGSTNPTAIKEFFRGEERFRRWELDSAFQHYGRALELDTAFALAYSRFGSVCGWLRNRLPTTCRNAGVYHAVRAASLNRGLAPRESLLIAFDGLYNQLYTWFADPVDVVRVRAMADRMVRDYPGDPDVWFRRGELHYHQYPYHQTALQTIRDEFAETVKLDSAYTPAYSHVASLDLFLESPDAARRTWEAYSKFAPGDSAATSLLLDLLDPLRAPARLKRLERALQSADDSAHALQASLTPYLWLRLWPDSAEISVELTRMRAKTSDRRAGALIHTLAYRGHLKEAYSVARNVWSSEVPLDVRAGWVWMLAGLGAVPRDDAIALLNECFPGSDAVDALCIYLGLRWAAQQGDTAVLERAATWFESARSFDSPPILLWRKSTQEWWQTAGEYFGSLARGYIALVQGDTAFALGVLPERPSCSTFFMCYLEVLTRADVLAAQGHDREAADLYERIPIRLEQRPVPHIVTAALGRARAHDRLGNREEAIESYTFVVDAWRHADPELQPSVEEARQALMRLAGEPGR